MHAVAGLLDGSRAGGAFLPRSMMEPPSWLRIAEVAPRTVVPVLPGRAWIFTGGAETTRVTTADIAGPSV